MDIKEELPLIELSTLSQTNCVRPRMENHGNYFGKSCDFFSFFVGREKSKHRSQELLIITNVLRVLGEWEMIAGCEKKY